MKWWKLLMFIQSSGNIYLIKNLNYFIMRYIALCFSFIYLLFAYWQINDPDPIWWIALYLISAAISFRVYKNKYSQESLIILSILYLANAINSFQQITNYEGFFTEGAGISMKTINQELAREATGLCICVFTFITYSIYFFAIEKRIIIKENYIQTKNVSSSITQPISKT